MRISIKLMGMLQDRTPDDGRLELPEPCTIGEVLDRLEIARATVQVFTVNGRLVRDQLQTLADGDELTILPPVGGG